jgi:hypothetical protein
MTSSCRAASILKSPLYIEFYILNKKMQVHCIGGRSVGIYPQTSSVYHNVPYVSYVPQVHCIGGRSVGIYPQTSSVYHNVPYVSYVPQVHCIGGRSVGLYPQTSSLRLRSEFYSTKTVL